MSYDNLYPNRKDWISPYRKSKRFDRSCRNHGSCSWCEGNRTHKYVKSEYSASEQERDFLRGIDEIVD